MTREEAIIMAVKRVAIECLLCRADIHGWPFRGSNAEAWANEHKVIVARKYREILEWDAFVGALDRQAYIRRYLA